MDTIKRHHLIKRLAAWILREQFNTIEQRFAMQAHITRYWQREAEKRLDNYDTFVKYQKCPRCDT